MGVNTRPFPPKAWSDNSKSDRNQGLSGPRIYILIESSVVLRPGFCEIPVSTPLYGFQGGL